MEPRDIAVPSTPVSGGRHCSGEGRLPRCLTHRRQRGVVRRLVPAGAPIGLVRVKDTDPTEVEPRDPESQALRARGARSSSTTLAIAMGEARTAAIWGRAIRCVDGWRSAGWGADGA